MGWCRDVKIHSCYLVQPRKSESGSSVRSRLSRCTDSQFTVSQILVVAPRIKIKNVHDIFRTFEKILDALFKSGVERKKKGAASIKTYQQRK